MAAPGTSRRPWWPGGGYRRPTDPRLDELAAEAVAFDRAFSQALSTRPSLPTISTGLFDPLIRVPLIVKPPVSWPGPRGVRVDSLVELRALKSALVDA